MKEVERARVPGLKAEAVEAIIAETGRGRDGWLLDGLIVMNARAAAEELVGGQH